MTDKQYLPINQEKKSLEEFWQIFEMFNFGIFASIKTGSLWKNSNYIAEVLGYYFWKKRFRSDWLWTILVVAYKIVRTSTVVVVKIVGKLKMEWRFEISKENWVPCTSNNLISGEKNFFSITKWFEKRFSRLI